MNKPKSVALNIDCMEYMATLPDKAFDLAIADPPYGIGIANRSGSIGQKKGQGKLTNYKQKNWDDKIPSKEYFEEIQRVSKNQIIFGGNYFSHFLPPAKGWLVWNKKQPLGVTFAMAELAYTSFDCSVKMFEVSRKWIGNKVANNPRLAQKYIKIHPAEKPILLYSQILEYYAKAGDRILDTHLGSGNSRIAAYKLEFDFVGCEIDKSIFQDSVNNFKKECLNIQTLPNGRELIQTSLF